MKFKSKRVDESRADRKDAESEIALWSANFDLNTGQALVTRRVVEASLGNNVDWRCFVYSPGGIKMYATWAAAGLRLWWNIVRRRVDILYVVCSRSGGGFVRDVPALVAAFAGIRIVVHVHGSDIIALLKDRPYSFFARFLYRRCEVIVPSAHLLPQLVDIGLRQVHLCENFLHTSSGNVGHSNREDVNLRVLWNSNIMSSKGFFDVAAAIHRLFLTGTRIEFVCIGLPIGDVELDQESATLMVTKLRQHSWFSYLGPVRQEAVFDLCKSADAICLPSRYSSECQPLAIIEGMCSGRAIVVSDTPALRATVGDYPASFVSTIEGIADVLSDLVAQKEINQLVFSRARLKDARKARARFSIRRFDREMRRILL